MKRMLLYLLILVLLVPGTALAETPPPQKGIEVTDLSIEEGVIINIRLKATNCTMAGYYFGVIDKEPAPDNYDWVPTEDLVLRMTKWPGTYYFWARDTEGNAYGPTKVELPEDAYHVNLLHKNQDYPKKKLSEYLPEAQNTTVEEVNAQIAQSMAKAGAFTREGVVVGIMSQISIFQGYGVQIPFFHFGYWPFKENNWYLNPDWGYVYKGNQHDQDVYYGRISADVEAGTNCSGLIHYAYRLAGINTVYTNSEGNAGGLLGKDSKRQSPYAGLAGDVMTSRTDHEMLIIDKYDDDKDGQSDGYIVAESAVDTGGIGYKKHDFKTYSRFCDVWNMDGAFYNTAAPNSRLKFWNSYHAPKDTWPDFFREAVMAYSRYQVVYIDAYGENETFTVGIDETITPPAVRNNLEAKKGYWSQDLTNVPIRGNYVIEAVYTEEDGGLSWLEEQSRTPEPTFTPAPTATPEPTRDPADIRPEVEVFTPAPTQAPTAAPVSTPTAEPLPPQSSTRGAQMLIIAAGVLVILGGAAAAILVLRRGRSKP
ncbi:MAG: hypothetical protein IJR17_02840 [Clostridia bacterium]|nr:hypothetical protein [Clostridia bacterium]